MLYVDKFTQSDLAPFDVRYTNIQQNTDIATKGLKTGQIVRTADATEMTNIEQSVLTALYYDERGRVVQTRGNNRMGGYDYDFFQYSFTGNVLRHRHVHKSSYIASALTEEYGFTYDAALRLVTTTHKINTQREIILSVNSTVTGVRTPTVNVQNSDGSITPTKLTTFEMKVDDKATQLFEFMANPSRTTNVEWSHAKVGTESSGHNIVGTSHSQSSTAVGHYLRVTGYTLREVNHNHPSGVGRPSGGDLRGAELYHGRNRNTILNIYTYPSQYFRYNQNGLITP